MLSRLQGHAASSVRYGGVGTVSGVFRGEKKSGLHQSGKVSIMAAAAEGRERFDLASRRETGGY